MNTGCGGKTPEEGSGDLAGVESTGLMDIEGVGGRSKVMLGFKLGRLEDGLAHQSGGVWRRRGRKGARLGRLSPVIFNWGSKPIDLLYSII